MPPDPVLPDAFFDRPVRTVAPELLGCFVEHESSDGLVRVRLTEVEAYDGEHDPGSHAFRGQTKRNAVMFGPPGRVYVYFTYGMHWCMNLVCGPVGQASAVLLRAGEVVLGADLAQRRRPSARTERELSRGPARLVTALGVDGSFDGVRATDRRSALRVRRGPRPTGDLATGPRVGVGGDGAHQPWRYWIADDPTVSAYRPAVIRRRRSAASGRLDPAASATSPQLAPASRSAKKGVPGHVER